MQLWTINMAEKTRYMGFRPMLRQSLASDLQLVAAAAHAHRCNSSVSVPQQPSRSRIPHLQQPCHCPLRLQQARYAIMTQYHIIIDKFRHCLQCLIVFGNMGFDGWPRLATSAATFVLSVTAPRFRHAA